MANLTTMFETNNVISSTREKISLELSVNLNTKHRSSPLICSLFKEEVFVCALKRIGGESSFKLHIYLSTRGRSCLPSYGKPQQSCIGRFSRESFQPRQPSARSLTYTAAELTPT